MVTNFKHRTGALVMLSVAALVGCGSSEGPELARVTGVVRLDGQPLPKAVVRFQPVAGEGSYSSGITNESGEFTLQYSRDRNGALPGEHTVFITTGNEHAEDELGKPKPIPEILPAVYHRDSILKEQITSGRNHIELELQSQPLRQPPRQSRR